MRILRRRGGRRRRRETTPGAGAGARVPTPPPAPEPSWMYGPEVPLGKNLNPLAFDALFTAEGVATLEGVQVAAATAGGTHTLRIVDATPGRYGDLGRCAEARVVVDVEALPEPEEPEGEEAAPEAEGGGGEEE